MRTYIQTDRQTNTETRKKKKDKEIRWMDEL